MVALRDDAGNAVVRQVSSHDPIVCLSSRGGAPSAIRLRASLSFPRASARFLPYTLSRFRSPSGAVYRVDASQSPFGRCRYEPSPSAAVSP